MQRCFRVRAQFPSAASVLHALSTLSESALRLAVMIGAKFPDADMRVLCLPCPTPVAPPCYYTSVRTSVFTLPVVYSFFRLVVFILRAAVNDVSRLSFQHLVLHILGSNVPTSACVWMSARARAQVWALHLCVAFLAPPVRLCALLRSYTLCAVSQTRELSACAPPFRRTSSRRF